MESLQGLFTNRLSASWLYFLEGGCGLNLIISTPNAWLKVRIRDWNVVCTGKIWKTTFSGRNIAQYAPKNHKTGGRPDHALTKTSHENWRLLLITLAGYLPLSRFQRSPFRPPYWIHPVIGKVTLKNWRTLKKGGNPLEESRYEIRENEARS